MVASLTGFGRGELTDATGRIAVELKSVNNRFLQLDVHVPWGYGWADSQLRSLISERVSRGKVSVNLEIVDYAPTQQAVVNRPLLKSFIDLAIDLEKETDRPLPLRLDGMLGLPGVMKVDSEKTDQNVIWARIKPVAEKAIATFIESRKREGANLAADILRRKERLEECRTAIEERIPQYRAAFIERFTARIKELAGQAGIDDSRLSSEIAIWTDRSDISEELTRLSSHLKELGAIMQSTEPIGRRLDFLLQELNREANTTGSKVGDILVIQQVLDIKCEIEKIREQAQNIE
ncbi:MAG TPA: YicC family protein [Candidatus Ozemobacteraceae bacterium]|nr:YicC family protein [Candidatus Ozemobacteraceae bacterium]